MHNNKCATINEQQLMREGSRPKCLVGRDARTTGVLRQQSPAVGRDLVSRVGWSLQTITTRKRAGGVRASVM